jgi:hypothetical protein
MKLSSGIQNAHERVYKRSGEEDVARAGRDELGDYLWLEAWKVGEVGVQGDDCGNRDSAAWWKRGQAYFDFLDGLTHRKKPWRERISE